VELRVNGSENAGGDSLNELSRLTAEFESFIKNSQNDIRHETPRIMIDEKDVLEEKKIEEKPVRRDEETIKIDMKADENVGDRREIELKSSSKLEIRESTPEIKTVELQQIVTETRSFPEIQRITPTPTPSREQTPDYIPLTVREKFHVLRIEEDEATNSTTSTVSRTDNSESLPKLSSKEIDEVISHIHELEKRRLSETKAIQNEFTIVEEEITVAAPLQVKIISQEPKVVKEIKKVEPQMPPIIQKQKSVEEKVVKHSPTIQEQKNIFFNQDFQAQPLYIQEKTSTFINNERKILPNEIKMNQVETRIVRDRTPIPLARTELEDKLQSQGYKKTELSNQNEQNVLHKNESGNSVSNKIKNFNHDDEEDEGVILRDDEAPKVPERRRSVKEIIESINRQQQKLKINHPPSPQLPRKYYYGDQKFSYHEKPALPSKDNVLLKLQRQAESERKINELLDDLKDFNRNDDVRSSFQHSQKFPVAPLRDSNNNHSNCQTFPNERISRDDINPIPKPRRYL
jgi:hypothetical protein